MSDPTTETSKTEPPAGETTVIWPEEPIEMQHEMMSEQAKSLHDMFSSLRTRSMETFHKYPADAQAYIRLALRAQANCRLTMADVVRAEMAARRSRAEAEK